MKLENISGNGNTKVKLVTSPEREENSCTGCYLLNYSWLCPADYDCLKNHTIFVRDSKLHHLTISLPEEFVSG